MKQSDGTDLLGVDDPRSTTIGIIYVAPDDDRQSVLAAILTQEKRGRKQVVIVLPEQNKAFQRPIDFDGLKNMRRSLKAQIVFVAPQGPAEFARQRRFPVYSSLEDYAAELRNENIASRAAKRGWLFWRKQKPPTGVEQAETHPLPSNPSEQPSDSAHAQVKAPKNAKPPETAPKVPLTVNEPQIPASRTSPPGPSPRRSRRSWLVAVPLLLLLLLVGLVVLASTGLFGGLSIVIPGLASAVTVTITPARADLKSTYVLSAVTGHPNASQRQVQARLFSYTTAPQMKTVKATGIGHIPATVARGSLTFYNGLSFSQTITAGTVFVDANGVQVVNDKAAIIPAASPPLEGFVAVPAHALTPGASGNIPALDFNNVACCASGVTVQNATAFSGGQDQVDYAFVQQSDIDGAVSALKTSLMPGAETSFKAQILPGEQLVGPFQCMPDVASDHVAGDRVTSVTVTLTITCSGEVYQQQGAQSMAAKLLSDQALTNPGAGYMLVGNILTKVTEVKVTDASKGTIALSVSAEGVWVYQFSNAQKQALAKLIAGKSKQDAQTLLMQQTGVTKADIQLSWISGNTLPTDTSLIKIVVQRVPGVRGSAAPTP